MANTFKKELWKAVEKDTALQDLIMRKLTDNGYSIPTGDITVDVFAIEDENRKEALTKAVKIARELKVKDLAKIMYELKAWLTVREIGGDALAPVEQTLKDIDVTALATFALVILNANITHEE